jgi:hypothetical protein
MRTLDLVTVMSSAVAALTIAACSGGEGHIVLFDHATLQQVGRCSHQ